MVVGCATAAALIGGCGTGSTGHSGNKADPRQAIALAVKESAKIRSLTMVETVTMRGLGTSGAGGGLIPGGSAGSGGAGNGVLTARVNAKMRLRPTLLAAMSINMHVAGRPISIEEILTSRAIYMKVPGGLPTQAGKPWAKISLESLPNGLDLRKLFEKMQNGSPLTAMGSPKALAKFLANAKHLRVIGDQTVGGVTTTEYAGILNRNALMAAVPAAQKKVIRSSGVTNIPFRWWIDRQHHMRKMTMRLAMGKASMSLVANITSINAPVRIVPPPASQVSAISTQ